MMYKPDVSMGVIVSICAFFGLIIIVFSIMLAYINNRNKETGETKSIGCGTPILVTLILSISIGVLAAFVMGEHFKEGNYSEHECAICKKPSVYEVKSLSINYWYCEDHYRDAVQRYGHSDSLKEYSAKKKADQHPCAICGKTEGTKQINNNKIGGKWDENWYCTKHYADAWQYYYGDGK